MYEKYDPCTYKMKNRIIGKKSRKLLFLYPEFLLAEYGNSQEILDVQEPISIVPSYRFIV